jgi:GH15 family glucan-1,4-alpha-glucosidase
VPVYELTNTCMSGRYRIEKEVLTDPWRNVVLQKIRFVPLQGKLGDYRVYALLASHLANFGHGNTGWVGDYKGSRCFCPARLRACSGVLPRRCENVPSDLPASRTAGKTCRNISR